MSITPSGVPVTAVKVSGTRERFRGGDFVVKVPASSPNLIGVSLSFPIPHG